MSYGLFPVVLRRSLWPLNQLSRVCATMSRIQTAYCSRPKIKQGRVSHIRPSQPDQDGDLSNDNGCILSAWRCCSIASISNVHHRRPIQTPVDNSAENVSLQLHQRSHMLLGQGLQMDRRHGNQRSHHHLYRFDDRPHSWLGWLWWTNEFNGKPHYHILQG